MYYKSLFFLSALLLIANLQLIATGKQSNFLCAYMDGSAQDLRYCVSLDGYHFTEINKGETILKSTMGGQIIRDPQILHDKEGIYHLISTNAWSGQEIGIWDSKDLLNWENERVISIAPKNADMTWAPEAIYNEINDNYVFYWTSSLGNDTTSWSIYYATTKDFEKFSEPKILMHADNIILDANIVKYNKDKYYMFYRYNEKIWRTESNQLLGEYSNKTLIINANGEGPFIYNVEDNVWNMVWDYYKENGGLYGLAQSNDLNTWTLLTNKTYPFYNAKVSFPKGVRHGSIIPISKMQLNKIIKQYEK